MDTVAGYTAYKTLFTLVVLGAVWGCSSRPGCCGRGRRRPLELLLAGRTTRGRAARQVVTGLAAGLGALWLPTASSPPPGPVLDRRHRRRGVAVLRQPPSWPRRPCHGRRRLASQVAAPATPPT